MGLEFIFNSALIRNIGNTMVCCSVALLLHTKRSCVSIVNEVTPVLLGNNIKKSSTTGQRAYQHIALCFSSPCPK